MTTIKKLQKDIEKRIIAVGKERDRLDNVIDEARGLKDTCERAIDALEEARDALSELA